MYGGHGHTIVVWCLVAVDVPQCMVAIDAPWWPWRYRGSKCMVAMDSL